MSRRDKRFKVVFKELYRFYGPQSWWPAETSLEVIVGAILTQNTSWGNVEKAIANLKMAGSIDSPRALKNIGAKKLASLIRPAGYYNIKAARLKNFISFLFRRYGGSIAKAARCSTDKLREELLGIGGVGPETCDSILLYAFDRPVFVIDAYTKRVFSRHGFFSERISYEEARSFFMKNLTRDTALFNEFHALIVRLAKDFCKTRPLCTGCPLKKIGALAPTKLYSYPTALRAK